MAFKHRKAPQAQYECKSCGQTVTQTVGWSTCPHCDQMGQLVPVKKEKT